MKTKDERTRFILQHKHQGYFINVVGEKTFDFMKATRWHDTDEVEVFLNGRFKPEQPEDFRAVPVKVTYELGETGDGE
ncbi:hypothetical protein [Paenibacillus macerans]|uniref:hypothetical protein n=1 Tax=Paenibacillus macerans TaxID=44252 RepID=UPI00203B973F|nr:hypothetical protein [Paenibacillus macerans]MCM3703773.1 hypothetical protein [Paenibacillus macerans]